MAAANIAQSGMIFKQFFQWLQGQYDRGSLTHSLSVIVGLQKPDP